MAEVVAIASLAVTVVSAIFAFTGPLLGKLWNKFKQFYGRACNTTSYLHSLGQQRVLTDLKQLLSSDAALRVAAQRYYIQHEPDGGGDEDDGWSSDFSDITFR
ncbi:hypothetical protein OQA88_8311 [Cercophora sp. LCS_1]